MILAEEVGLISLGSPFGVREERAELSKREIVSIL